MNRFPTKATGNKIPYTVLTGKTPYYKHMWSFECLVDYKDLTVKDKFEPRGRRGVFIGYPLRQKGYKIYDLEKRHVVISREVAFFENHFPFSKEASNDDECVTNTPYVWHDEIVGPHVLQEPQNIPRPPANRKWPNPFSSKTTCRTTT